MAKLLVRFGAYVDDASMKDGVTPLHCAARGGYSDIVRLFLDEDCDLLAMDHSKQSAIHLAAESGDEVTVRLLLDAGANPNQESKEKPPLHRACYGGHKGVARILINKGADIHKYAGYKWTPLHNAIFGRNEDIARLLITVGAHIDEKSLHYAVVTKQEAIATFLLDQGADIQAETMRGTALHQAVREGLTEMTHMLIRRGADINAQKSYVGSAKQRCLWLSVMATRK